MLILSHVLRDLGVRDDGQRFSLAPEQPRARERSYGHRRPDSTARASSRLPCAASRRTRRNDTVSLAGEEGTGTPSSRYCFDQTANS